MRGDRDAAERVAVAGRRSSARAANASRRRRVGQLLSARCSTRRSGARSIAREPVLELALLDVAVERGQRLLPQQRRAGVGEQQRAGHDQHRREPRTPRRGAASARAAADSVLAERARCRA